MLKIFSGKKAQAAAAATLLAIIAASLIMFVLFVNPDDRAEILGDDTISEIDDERRIIEEVLLEETPGRIEYLELEEIEHNLASVRVYTKTESKELYGKNSLSIKNGLFSNDESEFDFTIQDLDETKDLLLTFHVDESQGSVQIYFNGEELFNKAVDAGENPAIEIPDYLLEKTNTILIKSNSPGLAIWKTNYIDLEDLKIIAEVTDTRFQKAKNTFLVSETEYNNLESLELRFQPDCDYDHVGRLIIEINGRTVYAGVPDCGLEFVPSEFAIDIVNLGENEITFYTEGGEYELSHIRVISTLEEIEYPTYYFELDHEEFESIGDDEFFVEATIEFTDDTNVKQGHINVNGHKSHFDTRELSEGIEISSDVVQGNNAIRLVPGNTLEVREFIVELVEE